MTKILFTASVAFVGYVIYVFVEEQLRTAKNLIAEARLGLPAKIVEPLAPKPAKVRAKPTKARTKEKKAATIFVNLAESVGMAAGSIWRYLNDKGPTAVVKLVRELPEDNKTLQRSIGWLAQEDKITLETIGRVETVALKN